VSVTLTCPKCGRVVKVPKTVHYYAGFLICKACGGRIPLTLKRAFRREWDNYILNGGIFCNMAEKSITFERLMRRG
jgi:transcription elongation factor Elf1